MHLQAVAPNKLHVYGVLTHTTYRKRLTILSITLHYCAMVITEQDCTFTKPSVIFHPQPCTEERPLILTFVKTIAFIYRIC